MTNHISLLRIIGLLSIVGFRQHLRRPLTLLAVIVGFATSGFLLSIIWMTYQSFGESFSSANAERDLLILSRYADSLASSRLSAKELSVIGTLAHERGWSNASKVALDVVQLETRNCKPAISVSVVAHSPLLDNTTLPATARGDVLVSKGLAERCEISDGDILNFAGKSFTGLVATTTTDPIITDAIIMAPSNLRTIREDTAMPNIIHIPDAASPEMTENSYDSIKIINRADYNAKQTEELRLPTIIATIEVGGLMVVSSLVAMLLAMDIVVAARARQLSQFTVEGFTRRELASALAIEAGAIAALGAMLGIAAVYILFGTETISILSLGTGAQKLLSIAPSTAIIVFVMSLSFALAALATYFLALRLLARLVETLPKAVKNQVG